MTDPMRPTGWKPWTLSERCWIRFCKNPPTKEPAMPSTMVPRMPSGSRPGMSRRAIAPTMNPTISSMMMKASMPVILPLASYALAAGSVTACPAAALAARAGYQTAMPPAFHQSGQSHDMSCRGRAQAARVPPPPRAGGIPAAGGRRTADGLPPGANPRFAPGMALPAGPGMALRAGPGMALRAEPVSHQQVFLHLACARLRQLVGAQERDLARHLEGGQVAAAVTQQLGLAGLRSLAGDHPGPADLAEPLVRNARDVGLRDALVAGEHLFYLLGGDELAAHLE